MATNVSTRIKLKRTFDRNVEVDRDFPLPALAVNDPLGELAEDAVAKTDDNAFIGTLF